MAVGFGPATATKDAYASVLRLDSTPVSVAEAFFSVNVADMARASAFYVQAFGATVTFSSARWSSLRIAGVRIALALGSSGATGLIGLHFTVSDLAGACAAVEHAGGRIASAPTDVAPGVTVALVTDTEGNTFTLRGS